MSLEAWTRSGRFAEVLATHKCDGVTNNYLPNCLWTLHLEKTPYKIIMATSAFSMGMSLVQAPRLRTGTIVVRTCIFAFINSFFRRCSARFLWRLGSSLCLLCLVTHSQPSCSSHAVSNNPILKSFKESPWDQECGVECKLTTHCHLQLAQCALQSSRPWTPGMHGKLSMLVFVVRYAYVHL